MKMIRRMLLLMMTLMLLMPAASAEPVLYRYTLGSTVQDFTVTTYDGREITLSEVLKEKDMVLINIWATWCGYCVTEFPYLEEAYQQYKDRVEVIAVTCEPTDTDDVLAEFAASHGLTFPMARDTAYLSSQFYSDGIPVSVVVDRFGVVCFMQSGAQPSADAFRRLFDAFVGEGYTESRLLNRIPAMKPNIPDAEPDRLAEALNVPGGTLTFANSGNTYDWPMIPAEEDGRLCVVSTNVGAGEAQSVLYTDVTAASGDAVEITFKTSTEAPQDLLHMTVNGKTVKVFGGEKDWMTYAHAFDAAGTYRVGLHYRKDAEGNAGEDVVYIDSVAHLTGEDAAAACAANPAYPVSAANTLQVTNADARQIIFDDPTYALMSLFGLADYYIVPGGQAKLLAELDAATDPEGVVLANFYDSSIRGVMRMMTDAGYAFTSPVDSMATTGYPYTDIRLYPSMTCNVMDVRTVVCFTDEENADAFITMLNMYGMNVKGWSYAPDEDEMQIPELRGMDGQATYTLVFTDQHGEPVSGVMANICDEERCMPMFSDVTGMISFTDVPYPYDVHVILVPEGYSFDTAQDFTAPAEGGVMTFTITKN